MPILKLLPQGVMDYLRLWRVRWRYPGRDVETSRVHATAGLGVGCRLARGVEIGAGVRFGDLSYANEGTIVASGTIGKFCSIGYYCQIGMHEHPSGSLSTSPFLYGARNLFGTESCCIEFSHPPQIENDVWIGSHATVLQGVHVGNGAVIAAGAVVTKDVAPFAIVAGVPAKLIRYRFGAAQIAAALELAWWNLPLAELRHRQSLFQAGDRWYEELSAADTGDGKEAA